MADGQGEGVAPAKRHRNPTKGGVKAKQRQSVRARIERLKERLKRGSLTAGEPADFAAEWGVSTSQFERAHQRARAELEAEAQPAVVKARAGLLLDRASADADDIDDASKRSAARVRIAMALLDLHGLRKPSAPDDGKPSPPALSTAEQLARAEAARKAGGP